MSQIHTGGAKIGALYIIRATQNNIKDWLLCVVSILTYKRGKSQSQSLLAKIVEQLLEDEDGSGGAEDDERLSSEHTEDRPR